jgi:hypothetical protein
LDEREAAWIAEDWSGSRGLVPRGPRWLLGFGRAEPGDVERHTGQRPVSGADIWRIEVGGRFLRAGGTVYPGGVPYPRELAGQTATVSSEVWLYVDGRSSRVLGSHSWPEAIRRPVAARPTGDFDPEIVVHPDDAAERVDFELPCPAHPDWWTATIACLSRASAIVFLARGVVPEPLNEMQLFEEGGLSLRVSAADSPDFDRLLRAHQPPFRRCRGVGTTAIGREPGRALGPQTWPWPGELLWWRKGLTLELKGFVPLETLEEVARTI